MRSSAAQGEFEDIAAAQEMTPEEQQQMIMSMVNGLAERLEAEPNNPDGWARLMQAYMVLGREDDAKAAFEKASTVTDHELSDPSELAAKRVAGPATQEGAVA